MSYSIDALSDNCYPDTTVLINKYDIRDEQRLADVETLIVSAKTVQLEITPIQGQFDFEHYKAVHRILFGDLYDWAGQVRTVSLSKKETHFCPAEQIEEHAIAIFGRLRQQHFFRIIHFPLLYRNLLISIVLLINFILFGKEMVGLNVLF